MGFRCPNCSKDFGNDQTLLRKHLADAAECSSDTNYNLMKIEFNANILVEKKKREIVYTTPGMYKELDFKANNVKRQYDFIGDHDWEKLNAVSKTDGEDDLRCRKCGLTATRFFNTIKPDKRFSANKIENCKNKV